MTTRNLAFVALFAAFIAVLGLFPKVEIPIIPVPITAQNLGIMLAGAVLGAYRGGLSVILFLVLVAIGLPLLPGGRGGIGVFAGPTAGFLFGWPVGAFVTGLIVERLWKRMNFAWMMLACLAGGILVVYTIGNLWLAYFNNLDVAQVFYGSLLFIPGDIIKAVIATSVALLVRRSYPIIRTQET